MSSDICKYYSVQVWSNETFYDLLLSGESGESGKR